MSSENFYWTQATPSLFYLLLTGLINLGSVSSYQISAQESRLLSSLTFYCIKFVVKILYLIPLSFAIE